MDEQKTSPEPERLRQQALLRVRTLAGNGMLPSGLRFRRIVDVIREVAPEALGEAPPEEPAARRGRGRDRQERGGQDRSE
jgi:hypothetical protein